MRPFIERLQDDAPILYQRENAASAALGLDWLDRLAVLALNQLRRRPGEPDILGELDVLGNLDVCIAGRRSRRKAGTFSLRAEWAYV